MTKGLSGGTTVSANRLLYFLAILIVIVPFLLQSGYYGPHRDELLYLAEGRHMAWGFMEVPPMLSLFAFITDLFGGGLFWIKIWPALFGAGTFIICAKTLQALGGKTLALCLLFLPFVFGVYLRLFFLFQPNCPEVFFDTLIAFGLIRYIQTGSMKWLYLFGVAAGLGMMSKYSVGVFIISMVLGLLLTRSRKVLFNKHFWIASLIGFLIFLPNLIWQFMHGLPIIHHMELLNKYQLQYVTPTGFLKDQLLMNLPTIYIWITGLGFLLFSKRLQAYRFVGLAFLSVLLILIILHGKNYYALGAYPIVFAFGAYSIERLITNRTARILITVLIFYTVTLGVFLIPLMLPVWKPAKLAGYYQKTGAAKTGLLQWEDLKNHPLPQDFADMLGWQEIAVKVSKAYNLLDAAQKSRTIIYCDNYGQAGAVDYYKDKLNLPTPLSDNASYLNWIPESLSMNLENIVLVTDDHHEMSHPFIKECQEAILVDSVTNPYAKEKGSLIILLKGVNDQFKKMVKMKIERERAVFK